MSAWYKVSINGGEGYMKVVDGNFAGYFDLSGSPLTPDQGTTVFVTENDVAGPANA